MSQKVAIITAASRGMGAAIAKELAANEYRLVLLSSSNAVEEIAKLVDGTPVIGSILSPDDLKTLVDTAMSVHGRIDAVVNNTGHPPKGDLLKITDDQWHLGVDMVMMNVVRMARLVTPIMQAQGEGAIVNISTFAAFEPSRSFPVSATFRAALAAFTKLYADEYAKDNIRMNNVLPGFIDSYPETDDLIQQIPMGRFGKVEEIAQTVHFLLSDASGYITGQNLRADGGITRSV